MLPLEQQDQRLDPDDNEKNDENGNYDCQTTPEGTCDPPPGPVDEMAELQNDEDDPEKTEGSNPLLGYLLGYLDISLH